MVGPQGNPDTCLKLMVQTEQPGRHGTPPAARVPWSAVSTSMLCLELPQSHRGAMGTWPLCWQWRCRVGIPAPANGNRQMPFLRPLFSS